MVNSQYLPSCSKYNFSENGTSARRGGYGDLESESDYGMLAHRYLEYESEYGMVVH